MKKEKLDKNQEIQSITLYKYHKKMALFGFFCGLAWLIYSVIDKKIFSGQTQGGYKVLDVVISLIFIVSILVMILAMIIYSSNYKREDMDEMYIQNVAKADHTFILLMAVIGSVIVTTCIFNDEKTIQINSEVVTGMAFIVKSVYHFMILYYDKTENDIDKLDYEQE